MEIKSVGEVVATRALLLMGDNSGKEILVQIGKPCPFPDGFSYDALSRRTQMTRPNGIATNYSYDNLSRLLSILHQAGGSTIDGASYTLDAAGNRLSNTNWLAGATTNYGYDSIYELLQATQGANLTENYTYDPVGNRLSSLAASYSVNSSNEMTAAGGEMYTYDYNGNTTTKTDSTGTTNYTWDFENRLTQVTLPGSGGTVSFKYDPFGRRIYKSSPNATSIFAYDGDNLVETMNATGGLVAHYTQGQNIDEPLAMQRGATTDYYEADGLGSITSLTASNGTVAQSYAYDSFGNTTNSSGTLRNYFRYTAREFDTETGLYYLRERYFDSAAGRFLSEDPVGFDGDSPDFYVYVQNDPVNWIDPFGLQHTPGGPYHPAGPSRCTKDQPCAQLLENIYENARTVASHGMFDLNSGIPRHTTDIISYGGALARCIKIYNKKCVPGSPSCPQSQPEPGPAPAPAPIPVPSLSPQQAAQGMNVIGTLGLIIIILLSPAGV